MPRLVGFAVGIATGAVLYVLLALIVVLGFLALASIKPANASPPNIVVIMTDDQDVQSLQYMPKTKALLADKGVTFTNSFVQFSQCCPSRSTWLSGQMAHNHGVLGNSVDWHGAYPYWKPQEANSLPVWLKNAGYYTGFMGKVMNDFNREPYHVPPGWSWFRGMKKEGYYDWIVYGVYNDLVPQTEYSTDNFATRTKNFVTVRPEPFALFVWPYAPHIDGSGRAVPAVRHAGMYSNAAMPRSPAFNSQHTTGKHPIVQAFPQLTPAEVTETELGWRAYIETLQAVDDLVEKTVNELIANGRISNTYIIFTADNGYLHGDWKRRGKALPYERSVRVPLIIRGPGLPQGVTSNALVTNVDLVATITAISGTVPLRVLDGKNILPLFGPNPPAWRSAFMMTGMFDPAQVYDSGHTRWNAVRTKTRKYIRASDGHEELYDLQADTWERFSVVNDPYYAGDLTTLRALEADLRDCIGNDCWVP